MPQNYTLVCFGPLEADTVLSDQCRDPTTDWPLSLEPEAGPAVPTLLNIVTLQWRDIRLSCGGTRGSPTFLRAISCFLNPNRYSKPE
ncbi:hypothetical protein DPEC_G00211050 [Dallia pectoralis]|uniref:Uncharacterized protein n=1 Tax=Dallia pectoralis TaxID=75939 RepID=A0ACC2G5T8_DALPE|nr:hypothetical protein DPEC_G00211050 [Dallia pectoralis]